MVETSAVECELSIDFLSITQKEVLDNVSHVSKPATAQCVVMCSERGFPVARHSRDAVN
jgi:hypothetical protein